MSALIIDGHPNPDSLVAALARRYANAYPGAELLALRDLQIDPILHRGLHGGQALEPDLVDAARRIAEADHVVIASPVWWDSTPALLKGFFDRVLQAGWAYRYRGHLPIGLLKGRSARVLLTSDSPGWYLRWAKRDTPIRQLRTGTLRFVGMRPVRVSRFTGVRTADAERRAAWFDRVDRIAAADARRPKGVPSEPGPLVARDRRAEPAPAA